MDPKVNYWFAAKRYGWGWGMPIAWQGWVVVAAYFALFVAGTFIFPIDQATGALIAYTIGITALLMVVCWLTGEPPRWRWGDD